MDDHGGVDAAEIERAPAQAPGMDAASLPSFKRLPPHRRADHRRPESPGDLLPEPEPITPRQAMRMPPRTRPPVPKPAWLEVPEPARKPLPRRLPEPLHLTEAMRLVAVTPPAQRRRPWRAVGLLLLGAALGTAAALALSDAPSEGGPIVASKYLTVLPPAAPAAPPPQIVYVDKWQIVSPEPRVLQPYQVLPPAIPAPPPPQIVMIERAPAALPPRRVAESKRPPALPARAEAKARAPEPQREQHDVAKELEQWLSGGSDRR